MSWTLSELVEVAKKSLSFAVILESSPWEHGEGKTQRVLVHQDAEFPAGLADLQDTVLASFAIAQEWAAQLGEEVRLTISVDNGDGFRGLGVKTFEPDSTDQRRALYPRPDWLTPKPLSATAEKSVVELETGHPFFPTTCCLCGRVQAARTALVLQATGDYTTLVPFCQKHRQKVLPRPRSDEEFWADIERHKREMTPPPGVDMEKIGKAAVAAVMRSLGGQPDLRVPTTGVEEETARAQRRFARFLTWQIWRERILSFLEDMKFWNNR